MAKKEALFTIRVAAELTGAHPQTIRLYESKGLVCPRRSEGGTRLYSLEDIERIQEIISLSADGVTHAGIAHIIKLEDRIAEMEGQIDRLLSQNAQLKIALAKAQASQPTTAIVVRARPLPPSIIR